MLDLQTLMLILLVANRTTKGFPGIKGLRGPAGPPGYDGTFGMKGGKLVKLLWTWLLIILVIHVFSAVIAKNGLDGQLNPFVFSAQDRKGSLVTAVQVQDTQGHQVPVVHLVTQVKHVME